jgi:hypothetical protein
MTSKPPARIVIKAAGDYVNACTRGCIANFSSVMADIHCMTLHRV